MLALAGALTLLTGCVRSPPKPAAGDLKIVAILPVQALPDDNLVVEDRSLAARLEVTNTFPTDVIAPALFTLGSCGGSPGVCTGPAGYLAGYRPPTLISNRGLISTTSATGESGLGASRTRRRASKSRLTTAIRSKKSTRQTTGLLTVCLSSPLSNSVSSSFRFHLRRHRPRRAHQSETLRNDRPHSSLAHIRWPIPGLEQCSPSSLVERSTTTARPSQS